MPASPAAASPAASAAPVAEEVVRKRRKPVFKAKDHSHNLHVVRNFRHYLPSGKQLAGSVAIATQDEVRDVFTNLAKRALGLLPRGRHTVGPDQFMAALKNMRNDCDVVGTTSIITPAVLKDCEKEFRAITADREKKREERRIEREKNPKPKKKKDTVEAEAEAAAAVGVSEEDADEE